jgi:hypothetical protein
MRRDLLIAAEREFLNLYPGGFNNPEIDEIKKKHKPEKMHDLTIELFKEDNFENIEEIVENIVKIISRSSLVSVFEKTRFRDFGRSLDIKQKDMLSNGLKELLHGNHSEGFNNMIDVLAEGKLAKWPVISVIPYYYRPQTEVFLKPTTVKGIINIFELEGLIYNPRPTYEFYESYKKELIKMRKVVDKSLAPDNAAFSGFLMMMMDRMSDLKNL